MKRLTGLLALSTILSCTLLWGCATTGSQGANPDGVAPQRVDPGSTSRGEGTGIGSQDLQEVTDKMTRSILGTPEIANAAKPPVVVLIPVENATNFPINKQLFTMRIKALLNSQCRGKVMFAARDRIEAVEKERDLKREGQVTTGKQGEMAGADYFLTGELTGLSQAGATGRSDYILYTFRLINAETSIEVWEDFHEIKKEGLDNVSYR